MQEQERNECLKSEKTETERAEERKLENLTAFTCHEPRSVR